jgi:hypothetical protein
MSRLAALVVGVALAGCVQQLPVRPSINQPTPLYTGGDIPCSNARLHERVICG